MLFQDRFEAGKLLAKKLETYRNNQETIVLAVPRGGVQVGSALAKELHLPLDIILAKKIGHPFNPELAVGAVSPVGEYVDLHFLNDVSSAYLKKEIKDIRQRLQEQQVLYRGRKQLLSIAGKIVILTDDGAATGSTLLAALEVLRKDHPKKIIVAVPVASAEALALLQKKADNVICLSVPSPLVAIGQFYHQFEEVDDRAVIHLLRKATL